MKTVVEIPRCRRLSVPSPTATLPSRANPSPLPRCPMNATLPLLKATDFPRIARRALDTLQVNLGYKCNQACLHCHVNASPDRKEMMARDTIDDVLRVLAARRIGTLDVTGGAPELNPHFRHLVREARSLGVRVIDRCNLTILNEPGFEDLADFLAGERVEITASLPCYTKENVDRQRGDNVFESSILALQKLNALGYGIDATGLVLNLVYNPLGPSLPPAQETLEAAYKRELAAHFGIVFNRLYTLANMPIKRFGSTLVTQGTFASYMQLLRSAHNPDNLDERHVPVAGVGRLSRLPVRLRLQPDARHSARDRRQAAARVSPTC